MDRNNHNIHGTRGISPHRVNLLGRQGINVDIGLLTREMEWILYLMKCEVKVRFNDDLSLPALMKPIIPVS